MAVRKPKLKVIEGGKPTPKARPKAPVLVYYCDDCEFKGLFKDIVGHVKTLEHFNYTIRVTGTDQQYYLQVPPSNLQIWE